MDSLCIVHRLQRALQTKVIWKTVTLCLLIALVGSGCGSLPREQTGDAGRPTSSGCVDVFIDSMPSLPEATIVALALSDQSAFLSAVMYEVSRMHSVARYGSAQSLMEAVAAGRSLQRALEENREKILDAGNVSEVILNARLVTIKESCNVYLDLAAYLDVRSFFADQIKRGHLSISEIIDRAILSLGDTAHEGLLADYTVDGIRGRVGLVFYMRRKWYFGLKVKD